MGQNNFTFNSSIDNSSMISMTLKSCYFCCRKKMLIMANETDSHLNLHYYIQNISYKHMANKIITCCHEEVNSAQSLSTACSETIHTTFTYCMCEKGNIPTISLGCI